jgi:hypothetical protein
MNYLPRLASNVNPSDLFLPSSYDYKCEQPLPDFRSVLLISTKCTFWLIIRRVLYSSGGFVCLFMGPG